MTRALKIASYITLICLYLYLNKRKFRKVWLHYKKFSLRKLLGLVSFAFKPIKHHWFYRKQLNNTMIWVPFSKIDSDSLEEAFNSDLTPDTVVATDGGRYDVNILGRQRFPIYWRAEPNEVRRCSWFAKRFQDEAFIPYPEMVAEVLEAEFLKCFESRKWNRKIDLPNGDIVVFQRPDALVLLPPTPSATGVWEHTPQVQLKTLEIKRGIDDFDLADGERIILADHLLLVVHGIGSFCDLKFRSVEEVVDECRTVALKLVQNHYRTAYETGAVSRIEMLPINWHAKLHSEDTGIDKKLKNITLPSVPLIRHFVNDTLSDILLYKSPKYCQIILTTVGTELNRIYELFKLRNPTFHGNVFLAGHSLGSLILFDLLCYQQPNAEDQLARRISSMIREAGIEPAHVDYPHLQFHPITLFTLGSPISLFVTTIGLDELGVDFAFPTCPGFFNIFHPYDPVASRIETLVNHRLAEIDPVLIPHHKGGKRIHLQLKETMSRVKAKLRDRWKSSIRKVIQMGLLGRRRNFDDESDRRTEDVDEGPAAPQINLGILNKGRRIDYVLQEAPIESVNEYIFAITMSSHVCYWESEDTVLLILKEIYSSMGIDPDDPEQSLSNISIPKLSEMFTTSVQR